MDVSGSGAIVTGGASGLGLATVEALRSAGASVAIFDRQEPPVGVCDHFVKVDVSSEDQVREAVRSTVKAFGAIHTAVSCAGTGAVALAVGGRAALTAERFNLILRVNVTGTFNVNRFAAEAMSRNEPTADGERGVLIHTSSTVAFEGQVGTTAYAAAKGALISMTLPFARELGPLGIRVMTIAPGIFETNMYRYAPPEMQTWLEESEVFPHRPGKPPEFAALVRQIIENPMFNAETIRLDGGLRVGIGDHDWIQPSAPSR